MQAQTWIALFRHIPPERHPMFTLITKNGTEISIQLVMRMEADFAIIRGRLSGSQDAGRVFFIPYESIDTFSFTNPVKESEVAELFDGLKFEAQAVPAPPVAPSAIASRPSDQGSGPRPVLRSEVLERFRNGRPGSGLSLPRPNADG